MKAAAFEYLRPASVDEACALLAAHGPEAKLIAGGQSLVPMMAMRLARPAVLVDIHRIAGLKGIERSGARLVLGACARQQVLKDDDAVAAAVPLIRHALHWVGHLQTRNRGTVGGSLVHADPSAELPLAAMVLEATIVLRRAGAERVLPAAEFFEGPMQTATQPDECVTEIQWPVWTGRVGCAFDEVSARHGDFAMVSAAAQVQTDGEGRCTRAAFGLGGVDGVPVAFPQLAGKLVGSKLAAADLEAVAARAAAGIDPADDLHASAAYRRHLARVLLERVLAQARDRSSVAAPQS